MLAPSVVKLLILDCDGVLVRSEAANLAYYNHLFRSFGLPTVEREDRAGLSLLHTLSTAQVVDTFFPEDLRERGRSFATGLGFSPFLGQLEPEPGWDAALSRLRRSVRIAVATNRGESAREVLSSVGLLRHLDLLVTIRDVARPKPHPDVILAALAQLGVEAPAALYVGDSELDRQAAKAAGVPFLGFRTPAPPTAASAAEVEEYLLQFATTAVSASMASADPQKPSALGGSDEPKGSVQA